MEQLLLLVNTLFPGSTLEDSDTPEHKMIVDRRSQQGAKTEKRTLLFVKTITGEPAFFNMSISNKAFGPELIHEEDFKRLQHMMRDLNVSHCAYVIHSSDKQSFTHQFTFPIDRHYLEWIADD
jgi:hypothetical protein